MTLKVAVVCEAEADFIIASELCDRLMCETVVWIEGGVLDAFRSYVSAEGDYRPFLTWARAESLAKKDGLQIRGHFQGEPGALDARAARRAIMVTLMGCSGVDVIILIRDDDGETERRRGLEQARNESTLRNEIVIGLAHCTREAWVLAGFIAESDSEEKRLLELRQQLGFNPCSQAERLTAKHHHDRRSPKRVLAVLTDQIREREVKCWQDTSLDTLLALTALRLV